MSQEEKNTPQSTEPLASAPEKEDKPSTIFGASTIQAAPKKKKSRGIQITALILSLCLVAGLVTWLAVTAPKSDTTSESGSDESITFYNLKQTDVKEIVVTHKNEAPFTIYQKPAGGFAIASIAEFEGATNRYTAITNAVSNLTVQKQVTEKAEKLSEYGLDNPATTLQVTFQDGKSYTLLVGNVSSTISDGFYCKFADKDNIYISSAILYNNAPNKVADYISTTIVPAYDDGSVSADASALTYSSIVLGGTVRPQEIRLEPTPAAEQENNILATDYRIVSPRVAYINSDMLSNLTDSFFAVYATGVAYIHPTAAEKAACGLDQPVSTLAYKYKGGNVKISIGKTRGESCYVMREGVDLIYEAAISSFVWADYKLSDLHTSFLYALYITDLGSLSLTHNGVTDTFALQHGEDTSGSAEINVTHDGSAIDSTQFKKFYQVLITQKATDLAGTITSNTPVLTMTLTPTDTTKQAITVRFLPTGARTVAVEVNGVATFQASVSYTDNLVENLQKLLNHQTIQVDS